MQVGGGGGNRTRVEKTRLGGPPRIRRSLSCEGQRAGRPLCALGLDPHSVASAAHGTAAEADTAVPLRAVNLETPASRARIAKAPVG